MTYLEWLSERFRRGEGFAEENGRRRQARLAANNGQERPLVSLPHYLAALWNGQGAPSSSGTRPGKPVQGSQQAAAPNVSGPLPPPPKPPAVPDFALDEARNNLLRIREIGGILTNEMRDVTPAPSTAAELERAKRVKADAIINADQKYGTRRQRIARTAPASMPFRLSQSPQYQENLRIAREQVLGRKLGARPDTANGRTFIGNSSAILTSRPIGNSRQTVHQHFGPFSVGKRTTYDYTFNDPMPAQKKSKRRR